MKKLSKRMLAGGLSLFALVADQTASSKDFDAGCSYEKPGLAIVLDLTTRRSVADKIEAAAAAEYLKSAVAQGRVVQIYADDGSGIPLPLTSAGLCKPVSCEEPQHPWVTTVFLGKRKQVRTCAKWDFEEAVTNYETAIEAAFDVYNTESEASDSRTANTIARVVRDLQKGGVTSADLVYLGDGILNAPYARFSINAEWLTNQTAQDELIDKLRLQGALSDLTNVRVHFHLFGREINRNSPSLDLSTADRLRDFWERLIVSEQGGTVSFAAAFDPNALEQPNESSTR